MVGRAVLDDSYIHLAHDYVSHLRNVAKWKGYPFNKPNRDEVSTANIRNHVGMLRSFSSWPHREGFTRENVLAPRKVPKAESSYHFRCGHWRSKINVL